MTNEAVGVLDTAIELVKVPLTSKGELKYWVNEIPVEDIGAEDTVVSKTKRALNIKEMSVRRRQVQSWDPHLQGHMTAGHSTQRVAVVVRKRIFRRADCTLETGRCRSSMR